MSIQNKPTTVQEVVKAWEEYAQSIKNKNSRLYSVLIYSVPEFADNIINYRVSSVYQDNEIQSNKSDILNYMFRTLQNNQIQLNVIVDVENTKELIPYTSAEKFAAMIEKNQSLSLLQDMFNLVLQ